jgi:hypothetical protein
VNGEYSEQMVERAWVCDTCGVAVVKKEAHNAFHLILKELVNMAYPQEYEVDPPAPPPPPPESDPNVAHGAFTLKGGAKGG